MRSPESASESTAGKSAEKSGGGVAFAAGTSCSMVCRFQDFITISIRRTSCWGFFLSQAPRAGSNCGTADPVAGALVRYSESPTAGARCLTVAVAAIGDRAGAGDHNHARAVAESGFESDDIVSHNCDFAGNQFGDDAFYQFADLGPGCAGESDADAADLGRIKTGNRAGLTDGASQRLARLGFAHPDHVAGRACPCAQN